MQKFILVFIFLITPFFFLLAQDGKTLYEKKGCVACHGAGGKKTLLPTYPLLAGQHKEYLEQQLKSFKSGMRKGNFSAIMKPFAMSLSEKEMKAIAKYLSEVKP